MGVEADFKSNKSLKLAKDVKETNLISFTRDELGKENSYNVLLIGGSSLGHIHSEETKKKIGSFHKGKIVGESTRI